MPRQLVDFDHLNSVDARAIRMFVGNNAHLEAFARVADIAKHYRAKAVFKALIVIRDIEGGVAHEAYIIENKWRLHLKTWINNGQGLRAGKEAWKCL